VTEFRPNYVLKILNLYIYIWLIIIKWPSLLCFLPCFHALSQVSIANLGSGRPCLCILGTKFDMHGTELEKAGFLAPVKSPLSRSNGAQYVTPDSKIYCETVKMCRFSSGNWFFCLNSCSLPWLVKGATQLCISNKECNKLDLTAAQYFWLVDHNDWSRLFTLSSPHIHAVAGTVLLVGLPKTKQLNLHI
jgi:hypothetical protein